MSESRRAGGWWALALVVFLAGCAAEDDAMPGGVAPPSVGPDRVLDLPRESFHFTASDLMPGDLVRRGDLAIAVPEPGMNGELIAELAGGGAVTIAVASLEDGQVQIETRIEELRETNRCASQPQCADDELNNKPNYRWNETFGWYFRAASTPDANDVGNVEDRLRNAVTNITNAHNECGIDDTVGATANYRGRTSRHTGINSSTSSIECASFDGTNVVGFGVLPSAYLAVTCPYGLSNGDAYDADIKIDSAFHWFATPQVPGGCNNQYSIEAVMTHEFGHAFGQQHVSECTHANLTMSSRIPACSNGPSSLGWGDIKGLRSKY